jgi:Spy/CpxP family protein refolding chaperone
MRKGALLTFALSAAFFVALTANGQPPAGGQPGKGGKGGFGGGFGAGRGVPGQILSKGLQDQLKLTDDQKKALADLQKDIDAKLDKMLTDEQKAEFKKMKEAPMGGFGGPGGGGKGGFGKGGDKGGDKKKGD